MGNAYFCQAFLKALENSGEIQHQKSQSIHGRGHSLFYS